MALKVCHTPEDEKYIGWIWGGGERIKTPATVSFRPHPVPKCGLSPPTPPARRPAFLSGEEEGTARGRRRVRTHSGESVSSPTRPETGGAALVTANGDPGLQLLQAFSERPGGPELLTPPPLHVAERAWPPESWRIIPVLCKRVQDSGAGCWVTLSLRPVGQGALASRSPRPARGRYAGVRGGIRSCLRCRGTLGKSPPLPGPRCPRLGMG